MSNQSIKFLFSNLPTWPVYWEPSSVSTTRSLHLDPSSSWSYSSTEEGANTVSGCSTRMAPPTCKCCTTPGARNSVPWTICPTRPSTGRTPSGEETASEVPL
ncbi:hypothetical protein NPIL_526911 [Nephila pilipes]|uniref:Uncharacterized protein n=1 Tax=Nephila pilipes TaxID=299642 RepID=A0A8X6SZX5_NEPPI|nr:hypothetical protein NPIL_526911 [Nephila pilipes]